MERAPKNLVGLPAGEWPFIELEEIGAKQTNPRPLPLLYVLSVIRGWARAAMARLQQAQGQERTSALRIEARVALGPKKSVALIACRGRHFLVASTGEQIAPLVEVLPIPSEPRRARTGSRTNAPQQDEAAL